MLSIILIILKSESFMLRRLTDLTAYVLPAWLTNLVAACGLAHSMAAYGGLRWRVWGLTIGEASALGGIRNVTRLSRKVR